MLSDVSPSPYSAELDLRVTQSSASPYPRSAEYDPRGTYSINAKRASASLRGNSNKLARITRPFSVHAALSRELAMPRRNRVQQARPRGTLKSKLVL